MIAVPLPLQFGNDLKQFDALGWPQRSGRLVQDQDAVARDEGAHDLDHLLIRDRKRSSGLVGIDFDTKAGA